MAEAERLVSWTLLEIGRELRIARVNSGMRQGDVARLTHTSAAQMSRIEGGRVPSVSYRQLARAASAVGMKLTLKAWPAHRRLLDRPQLGLFNDFRGRSHAVWHWQAEVPMPILGDLRAADAVATRPGCRIVVELITRLADFQGQSRAALIKQRDLGADRVLLVIAGTTTNRQALREAGDAIRASFPLGTRDVLQAMALGRDPGANGIVLL